MHPTVCSHSLGGGRAADSCVWRGCRGPTGYTRWGQFCWLFDVHADLQACHALLVLRLACCMQYNLDPCGPTHILLGGKAPHVHVCCWCGTFTSKRACPPVALLHLQMEATLRARRCRPSTRHTTPQQPASSRRPPARRCAPRSRCGSGAAHATSPHAAKGFILRSVFMRRMASTAPHHSPPAPPTGRPLLATAS